MNDTCVTCEDCDRLLYLTVEHQLPFHGTPPEQSKDGQTVLPPREPVWCIGSGRSMRVGTGS